MKKRSWSPAKIILISILFGLLFWIADSMIHYFEFSSHLRMMIVQKPGSFADTLILNVYPHQLIGRLIFLFACIIGGVITIIFLSRQKEIEKELIESEEQYRNVTERANDAISIISDGKIQYVNPRFCEISGYSTRELIGASITKILKESEIPKVVDHYEKRMNNENVESVYEIIILHKNGAEIFIEINAGVITWKGSKADLIIARDITFRKIAEKALQENEEKYRTLINNINTGLYRNSVESDGTFIEVNPAFVKMFGYDSREEMLQLKAVQLYANTKDKEDFNRELMEKGFVTNREMLLQRKDKKTFWAKVTVMLIRDDNDNPQYYDGLVEDITERKQAEEQLKKTNIELRQLKENLEIKVKDAIKEIRDKDHLLIKQSRHASMGEMIGNIAHQWRQPLTAIAVLIQDIEEAYKYDELTQEYLEKSIKTTMDQLKYMSRTIDDFRNFFKPNKLKENFSANAVILKTLDFISNSFEHNQIELKIDLHKECEIMGVS
ncbi:MAG: PAS domain S-box protein [Candidatus Cloacimonetes bacterium]|nr:PAS domain S-box protein [Candidatus Cloacimonadota bacterium]